MESIRYYFDSVFCYCIRKKEHIDKKLDEENHGYCLGYETDIDDCSSDSELSVESAKFFQEG
jgi:hypothetical protein